MPRFATALRSEIRRLSQPEIGKLAKSMDALRRQIEDVATLVRKNGRTLLRLERRRVGGGGGGRRRARLTGPEARAFAPRALRALRARLAMSRVRFAKLLGVSPGSIFGWEKGRTVPGRASRSLLTKLRREGGPAKSPRAKAGRRPRKPAASKRS